MNRLRTDFLFAQPSFLSGLARILDLFGVFDAYNESRTPREADTRALYADWRVTGQDIFDCAEHFRQQKAVDTNQLQLFAQ